MPRSARSHPHPDLFGGLETPAASRRSARPDPVPPVPEAAPSALPQPVWLGLYLPSFALQALRDDCDHDKACVVTDSATGKQIIATNRAARRAGILPGHTLRSALALCADLQIVLRQPARETALLERLAQQLLGFTGKVVLQAPDALVLEVRGSLRLFGGIDALRERVLGQLRRAGLHVRHSVAPSATAALWLARAGQCPDAAEVVASGRRSADFLRRLNALDLEVTGWPASTCEALLQMGVQRIAECRRLPRAGLTRRFGSNLLQSLARAFAELPEVHAYVGEQQHFEAVVQLDAEITDAAQLATACDRLLAQLEAFLRQRQAATRCLEFVFYGWQRHSGHLNMRLSSAGFQCQHWQRLLAARLEHFELQEPAVAIGLQAALTDAPRQQSAALPLQHDSAATAADSADRQALHDLLDRLQARLGAAAVQALQHVSEHRPEYASQTVAPLAAALADVPLPQGWRLQGCAPDDDDTQRALLLQRPLWLSERPLPIAVDGRGVLHYEGALQLRHGPERIESAWWDCPAQVRDYFIAENTAGVRLWVFREFAPGSVQPQWWLHGIFG